MKKGSSIFFMFFLCVFQYAQAQQWMQLSQTYQQDLYVNPAYTGFKSTFKVAFTHRSQYVGHSARAIGTQFLGIYSPIASSHVGIGGRVINDYIGQQRYSLFEVNAAYHPLIKKHKLSVGVSGGLVQLTLHGDKLKTPGGNYNNGVIVHNDESLPTVKRGGVAPSVSLGIVYGVENFEFAVAMQNINAPKIKTTNSQVETNIFINRTISVSTLYVIELKKLNIIPLAFVKSDFLKVQALLQCMIDFKKIYFGAGFRGYSGLNNDAVIGYFGFRIKKNFNVSYSYDYNVSYLGKSNSGSHEVSLKYSLLKNYNKKAKNNIIFNPRFL